jgi:hypothetical protein
MFNLDDLMRGNKKPLETAGRDKLLGLIGMLLEERQDLLNALKPKPVDLFGRSEREIKKVNDYFNEGENSLADAYGDLNDSLDGANTSRHLTEEQLAAIERGDPIPDVRDHDIPDEA